MDFFPFWARSCGGNCSIGLQAWYFDDAFTVPVETVISRFIPVCEVAQANSLIFLFIFNLALDWGLNYNYHVFITVTQFRTQTLQNWISDILVIRTSRAACGQNSFPKTFLNTFYSAQVVSI